MIKKIMRHTFTFFLFGIFVFTACQNEDAPASDTSDIRSVELLQLTPLQSGEELAILHTSMGDIKVRFFPSEAPMAVENFITHAKNGYYDGIIFHRVISDFMIQGGDPTGTGRGGESIWGNTFGQEFSLNVRHFRGALAMAQSQMPNSIGSQFYIVQNNNLRRDFVNEFNLLKESQDEPIGEDEEGNVFTISDVMPLEVLDYYINNGGAPHLDMVMNEDGHTVFGHVVEGMDVVDAIAAVEVGGLDKPVVDVVINTISFEIVP